MTHVNRPRRLVLRVALAAIAVVAPLPRTAVLADEAAGVRRGQTAYRPADDESQVPPQFRLAAHEFPFQERRVLHESERIRVSHVTFPSPVQTPHENNNTVHCEYFRPAADPKPDQGYPGVIVLHILGGDFPLSRLFCTALAQHGVAAMFVKMPYYGPRRQPDVAARMISKNPRETVQGMTQAILDIRRAAAWLASQPEVDDRQLGVFGISLGGITAALAAAAEPRFIKLCPMLAGGDIAQITWDSPELADIRAAWIAQGGTRESLYELVQSIDPITYAATLRERKVDVLMLNARHDEIIPTRCTESLWQALGSPPIVWYDSGHVSALRHLLDGLDKVHRFFAREGSASRVVGNGAATTAP
jgi:dienelactone hydrolase